MTRTGRTSSFTLCLYACWELSALKQTTTAVLLDARRFGQLIMLDVNRMDTSSVRVQIQKRNETSSNAMLKHVLRDDCLGPLVGFITN